MKKKVNYNNDCHYEEYGVIPLSCFSGEEQFQRELASVRNCGEVKTVKHKTNLSAILKLTPFAKNSSSTANAGEGNARSFLAAFTLAEVLITLVIIGVIAAITIPNLITAYQKHVVETKVVKFYSMINNAMKLSTIDNGPIEDWAGGFILNNNFSITKMQEFADKYFTPYINYYKIEQRSSGSVSYYLPDNSRFYIFCDVNGFDIVYYPFGKASSPLTHSMFAFQLYERDLVSNNKMNSKNFVEPYTYEWNGTLATLKAGGKNGGNWACNKNATWPVYCTKLLQMNNWKITKDYPW